MLKFGYPIFFYGFAIIPVMLLFFIYMARNRKKTLAEMMDTDLQQEVIHNYSSVNIKRRATIYLILLTFLLIALIDPQIGTRLEVVKRQGVDIIVAVDVSKSMLANDIKPSRLEKAKKEIKDLISLLEGDRMALIVFSGLAFVQSPLTIDYAALELFTNTLEPGIIPQPGTAISAAIKEAVRSFPDTTDKFKVMVLMTDGEDHSPDAIDEAIKLAKENKVKIYTIGFGSPEGSLIPVYDDQGNLKEYKKDSQGNYVTSRLNTEVLEKIASETGGKFYLASTGKEELTDIYREVQQLDKKDISEREYAQFEDRFQIFLILGLLVLMLDIFRFELWKNR
ncbi:MAG: VWA domain-containing protein [Calditrichia bacterium]